MNRSQWRFSRNPRRPSFARAAGGDLLIVFEQRSFENHFDDGASAVDAAAHDGLRCPAALRRSSSPRNAPMFCTMSISCAPTRRAASVSATFASVEVAPSGNPTTVQTFTGDPASSASGQRNPICVHTNAREIVFARLAAELQNVGACGFGTQQRVVDKTRDAQAQSAT